MSIDALLHNIFELHNEISIKPEKTDCLDSCQIDQRVQKIIKEYELLKPGNQDLRAIYEKSGIFHKIDLIYPKDMAEALQLESNLIEAVSKALPALEVQKRIDRQKRFVEACMEHPSYELDLMDRSKFEGILKEGPVDFSAISMPYTATRNTTLLTYLLGNSAKLEIIRLLVKNGLTFSTTNQEEINAILNYLLPMGSTYKELPPCVMPVLDEFLVFGLDINACQTIGVGFDHGEAIPTDESTLLQRAIKKRNYNAMRNLVYHGAGVIGDEKLIKSIEDMTEAAIELSKALRLREEVIEKLQKELPPEDRKPYKDFSVVERMLVAKCCHAIEQFREAFFSTDPINLSLYGERIELHKQFFAVCLAGKFEEAEKLLSQGIDLNANFMPHPTYTQQYSPVHNFTTEYCPLLNHACAKGDVKLVEFLLKHGAKVNIGDEHRFARWLPPILECAISSIPNKQAIRDLLLKAGANPNEKMFNTNIHWGRLERLDNYFVKEGVDKCTLLNELILSGMDIDLSNGSGLSLLNMLVEYTLFLPRDHMFVERLALARILILYGAKISDENLERIKTEKDLKPLAEAIKIHESVRHEYLKEHLKELEDLRPLSMDLINVITSYTNDIILSPAQRIEIANRCLKTEKQGL